MSGIDSGVFTGQNCVQARCFSDDDSCVHMDDHYDPRTMGYDQVGIDDECVTHADKLRAKRCECP